MSVTQLIEMSNRYGSNEEYVLAGGGNTSYKDEKVLYVKGSGSSLATLTPAQLVAMNMQKLMAMLEKQYPAGDKERESAALSDMQAARLPGEEEKRPSVEAILHALFPQKFVLHVHPALVNGMTCGNNGAAICNELFGDDAVWVGLTKPGYILGVQCKKEFDDYNKRTGKVANLVFLQNHGVFAAADTVGEIDSMMERVFKKLKFQVETRPNFADVSFPEDECASIKKDLLKLYKGTEFTHVVHCVNNQVKKMVDSEQTMEPIMNPFTPDHIVYCKPRPLFITKRDDVEKAFAAFVERNGYQPKIIAVEKFGFFAFGRSDSDAETAKRLFLDGMKIAEYAKSFGGPLPLTDEFVDFILNWESESYRQKVSN